MIFNYNVNVINEKLEDLLYNKRKYFVTD